jgi:hypothetical protein
MADLGGKADLALDEWISRIDHGSEASKAALDEVFRLFAEERHIKQWRRLTPAILVRRLAVYRLRRTRAIGAEWRYPPGPPNPHCGPSRGSSVAVSHPPIDSGKDASNG